MEGVGDRWRTVTVQGKRGVMHAFEKRAFVELILKLEYALLFFVGVVGKHIKSSSDLLEVVTTVR